MESGRIRPVPPRTPSPAKKATAPAEGKGKKTKAPAKRKGKGKKAKAATTPPPRPQRRRYRFNWETPFILSHHNSRIYYCAGNHVFRSLNRGDNLKEISPDITRTERGSATAIAESAKNPDVLYVGSDDGALWGTRDGGKTWSNLWGPAPKAALVSAETGTAHPLAKLVPGPRWVTSLEASRFVEGRVYLSLDGHRSDDDNPYVLVSEDFGQTWKSLRSNLPWGSTRVLREDLENPNLLYVGTEFAIWASINRGQDWTRINGNLPTVAIHEVAQHPTAGEVVVGTHGRSLWVLDVTALRQMQPQQIADPARLFRPNAVVQWARRPRHGVSGGARRFTGQRPGSQAEILYSLGRNARTVRLTIRDAADKVLRTLDGSKTKMGLHRVTWDLRRETSASDRAERERRLRERFGKDWQRYLRYFRNRAPAVGHGQYHVVLEVDGKTFREPIEVQPDPGLAPSPASRSRR